MQYNIKFSKYWRKQSDNNCRNTNNIRSIKPSNISVSSHTAPATSLLLWTTYTHTWHIGREICCWTDLNRESNQPTNHQKQLAPNCRTAKLKRFAKQFEPLCLHSVSDKFRLTGHESKRQCCGRRPPAGSIRQYHELGQTRASLVFITHISCSVGSPVLLGYKWTRKLNWSN